MNFGLSVSGLRSLLLIRTPTLNPKAYSLDLVDLAGFYAYPDPWEDPKSRSLKGVPIKYPLVVRVPN